MDRTASDLTVGPRPGAAGPAATSSGARVYLTDIREFSEIGEVFRAVFPTDRPARTTVAVTALARDCRIEVEATAVVRT